MAAPLATTEPGLFKEIVCDNTMNGKPLPRNLGIVAACNPYRLRKRAASMDDDGAYEAANNGEGGVVGLANGIRDPIRVRNNKVALGVCGAAALRLCLLYAHTAA